MTLSSVARAILWPTDPSAFDIRTSAPGPSGRLPMTAGQLRQFSSGEIFGWTENAGIGWPPEDFGKDEFLILSTQGGLRDSDGSPLALPYSSGQWEIDILAAEAARCIKALGGVPFVAICSDHCDGRMQGNDGMMDSLPYRNDAAIVLRRLIRCLPTRKGIMGIVTCDKGLPAMMMALVAHPDLPAVLVPGGVTLPPQDGEDNGRLQSLSARFAQGEITLEYAQSVACRGCASPGGACQFLGTAATSQVVGEALGLTVPHAALAPSSQPIWRQMAARSAEALVDLRRQGSGVGKIVTNASIRNALVVHAAFGGSTNLLLHIPAIAHAAGLRRPTAADWIEVNRRVPRLVDALPNGPMNHPTVRVFLAGGVPEVMLKLRDLDLLDLDVLTVTGDRLGALLDHWAGSERRARLREVLWKADGVDPDDVIMDAAKAKSRGLTSTVTFPRGNIAPEGSVIKSTAIDPAVVDPDGVFRKRGPARVFLREGDAIDAIKSGAIHPGDVMLLICDGPMGSGMEETYQLTAALKHLPWGKHVALITDARFSGVSTGACIGHVGPEALAGGPLGKVLEGDIIEIVIDRNRLEGSVNVIGQARDNEGSWSVEHGNQLLARRPLRPDLSPRPGLPEDTRLWAALQAVGGGTWGGCVYDVDEIIKALHGV